MKKTILFTTLALACLLLFGLTGTVMAGDVTTTGEVNDQSGNGIVPIYVAGNPSCSDLGYPHGYKFDVFYTDGTANTHPLGLGTVSWTSDGTYVDWTSTFGVDAVIVKGGPNANSYVYDPPTESFGDTGLHSPINKDDPYGLSHVEFCYDYEVQVSKTAETSYTRKYKWTIDKSVTPETHDLFRGDSADSTYTVAVEKIVTEYDFKVTGTITIVNPDPTYKATITEVKDVLPGGTNISVNCGVSFPYELASKGTLTCSYSADLPDKDARVNTATVTTTGKVGCGSGVKDVIFGDPTTVVGYASIHVDDSNGGSWEFNDTGSVSYTKTFACDKDKGTHDNTATIRETGAKDDASVSVNCYALEVTKDAYTSHKRTWDWTVDKSADQTALTLSIGQQFLVHYTVALGAASTDSDWKVKGLITIKNPAPIEAKLDATLTEVSDLVSPDIAATVDCAGAEFPFTLKAGESLYCGYEANLPDASERTNTATAVLQNKPSGTTNFSGTAQVAFGAPTEIDECVAVTDDLYGALGEVCASGLPKSFEYSRYVGPYDVCGDYQVKNTATAVTNDTEKQIEDFWTLDVHVPCLCGCTLTPGYWKTHSIFGPAPYDDTWALIGENTPFFMSGQTWYGALWTNPAGGNAYWILAHAYIAAKLNILNGADPTVVTAQLAQAEAFFNAYKPTDKLSKTLRADIIALAGWLDAYNNGYIGPGHCSE